MANLRIGVLGGIGPQATGVFYLALIKKLQDEGLITSNKDFPQVLINSVPAPELVSNTITSEDLQAYITGIKELDTIGVDFIVMVCNTIHLYYDLLQQEVKTNILDLRKEVHKKIKKEHVETISVIGTACTIEKGLYAFDDIAYCNPSSEQIAVLADAICKFNSGQNKQKQVSRVRKVVDSLMHKGSQAVLLGCTEFAVMFQQMDLPTINSIDVLVDAVVEKCRTNRN